MLETERLRLRPFTLDDAEAFHAIWGDPEVIWWGANDTFEQSRDRLRGLLASQSAWPAGVAWFAVTPKHGDGVVGDVLLQPARFADGIEIGWHLRRDVWGKGYATEAARCVLAYALEELGLDRVYAIVATRNDRSLRVVDKLGMQRVCEMTYAELPHVLYFAAS